MALNFLKFKNEPISEIEVDENSISIPSKSILDVSFDGISIGPNQHFLEQFLPKFKDSKDHLIVFTGPSNGGKTFSLFGGKDNLGLLPKLTEQAFFEKKKVYITALEMYQTDLYDILGNGKKIIHRSKAKVLEITVDDDDLAEENVLLEKLVKFFFSLLKQRKTAATYKNLNSSRSHLILSLFVAEANYDFDTEQNEESTEHFLNDFNVQKLIFCDLCGNERVTETQATGTRLAEANIINTDLMFFWTWIRGISKGVHVSERNSSLTFLLSKMLRGHGKVQTVLINCVDGDDLTNVNEALKNSRFTDSAFTRLSTRKSLLPQNMQQNNQQKGYVDISKEELEELYTKINSLERENEMLRNSVENMADNTQSQLQTLTEDLRQRTNKLATYISKYEALNVSCNELIDSNEYLRDENEKLKQRIEGLVKTQSLHVIKGNTPLSKQNNTSSVISKFKNGKNSSKAQLEDENRLRSSSKFNIKAQTKTPVSLAVEDPNGKRTLLYQGFATPTKTGGTAVTFETITYAEERLFEDDEPEIVDKYHFNDQMMATSSSSSSSLSESHHSSKFEFEEDDIDVGITKTPEMRSKQEKIAAEQSQMKSVAMIFSPDPRFNQQQKEEEFDKEPKQESQQVEQIMEIMDETPKKHIGGPNSKYSQFMKHGTPLKNSPLRNQINVFSEETVLAKEISITTEMDIFSPAISNVDFGKSTDKFNIDVDVEIETPIKMAPDL
eukprot:TRINITY_DN3256_c0_g3_i1.p1 TRINITY_DN3256_c0_g3~~TRINITY_DN3256_c0_g3_i1.p1  ORF type:complete len:726 (+),score=220.64 TRINITY_DN3256_c0_g3_i1:60-2237(+)